MNPVVAGRTALSLRGTRLLASALRQLGKSRTGGYLSQRDRRVV